ncbi:hypothetical protein [Galbibacter mesophilus]|uniref:hypothetical protein n=1 Tax=Galbibacter mesophilus TaxID=379069 RepID=UPI00191DFA0A|nr:hypothetical protein [Galbibacter mesophilus]MCM5664453.1 hypothetical protein [Galbibacter mesophilus]
MNQNYLTLLLLFLVVSVHARVNPIDINGKDSLLVESDTIVLKPENVSSIDYSASLNYELNSISQKKLEALKARKYSQSSSPQVKAKKALEGLKQYRSFPSLDQKVMESPLAWYDGLAEFTKEYLEKVLKRDRKTDSVIVAAEKLFDELSKHGKFIDIIRGDELLEFPIGMKKDFGNSSITVGVINAKIHPQYAEVDLFAKLDLGVFGETLFFGAEGVKMSHQGGMYDQAKLKLLDDFPVGQNGGQWLFTFKGDFNQSKGTGEDQTYIVIDCEGKILEVNLEADVRIAKTVAVPLNDDGSLKYPGKKDPQSSESPVGNDSYVGASFSIKTNSFEDLLIDVSLPRFGLVALPNWGFYADKMVLDLSDLSNSENVKFPEIYNEQQLLVPGQENLWRGFYANEINITLPPQFRKKNSEKRITFGARGLLIDNFGVSGNFFAHNLLHINEGNASKWQFSVDSIHVDLQVNRFIEAGFNGKIVLPISKADSASGGLLKYKGLISADDHYHVQVDVEEDVDFNIFKGKAKLFPESYIKLEVDQGKFYPEANLTGIMAFNQGQKKTLDGISSTNEETDTEDIESLKFDGLSFQNFKIQTKTRPNLQIEYMGFKDTIALPSFYGFQLGFYDIKVKTEENDKAELGFNSFVNLDESGIKGDVRLRIIGKLEEGDYLRWRYDKTLVDSVEIDVKRKNFEFNGKLHFFKDSEIYGKGLAGKLRLRSTSLKLEMEASGIFGNTGDYRYWYVDAYGRPISSNNDNFTIYDIGGGVYHHMRKAGLDERGGSMSGIYYRPDKDTDFGFKALAAFEVKKSATFTGLIAIEMSFNSAAVGGGVSRIGFYGAAALMTSKSANSTTDSPFGSVDEMQKKVASKEESLGDFHKMSIDKEGIKYFATEVFPDVLTGKELFAAQVAIDFDFRNETYWGMFDVFLNTPAIKGAGEKNRLGYLEFYNAPDDWYIYVGTPTKRFGVQDIPIGIFKAKINLYYMTGTILPDPALPPANVIDILDLTGDELLFGRNFSNDLAQGRGYAFGAEFAVGIGFDWGIVYANVQAGVGFDLMIQDYGDAHCKGSSEQIGMDGWYATGQLYAYLQGEIGAQIKLFGFKKRVPILKAGMAVLAQGQLPNPWFIKGYAGVKVRVLGVVSISARLKVVIGEECEIIGKTGLQDVVVISDISPEDGRKDVDVFDAIQVAFNVPIGETVQIEEDEGTKTYRVSLKEIVIKDNGNSIEGEEIWNNTKDILTFESIDVLPPQVELTATVKVSFEERIGNQWKPVLENGQPIVEEKSVTFTTGKAPTKIPHKNILYMYPIVDQKYMLPKESDKGYVQLEKGQDYLFGNGFKDELFYITENGEFEKANFAYDNVSNLLTFEIPKLRNKENYSLQIITSKPKDGEQGVSAEETFNQINEDLAISSNKLTGNSSSEATLKRLAFNFSTSEYDTFEKKLNAMKVKNYFSYVDGASSIGAMGLQVETMEPFDVNEVAGTRFTANRPMIKAKARLDDYYYKEEIYPLLYKNYPLDNEFRVNREESILGLPPVKAITATSTYKNLSLDNPGHSYLKDNFPFRWRLAHAYYQDFRYLQYEISNKYRNNLDDQTYQMFKYILDGVFPYINVETYKVDFQYILPKKNSGNTTMVKYKNYF